MEEAYNPHGCKLSESKKILAESQRKNNHIPIQRYIQKRQLTNCLEWLEDRGYTGDIAVFMLSWLQWMGGEA